MDIRKVKKLIELLEESGIDELEIREGEESVRISRHSKTAAQPVYAQAPAFAAPVAAPAPVSYTHLRAHATGRKIVSRL
ncbi:acetyl-CoA carboxylase biotin carboxyl carrier protein, partial [Pseudomonas aeruginosa]|nr:acetyl-CoA carboxylase biotin carboxyl carrier protein [Pseudomonas aeruginosa]